MQFKLTRNFEYAIRAISDVLQKEETEQKYIPTEKEFIFEAIKNSRGTCHPMTITILVKEIYSERL